MPERQVFYFGGHFQRKDIYLEPYEANEDKTFDLQTLFDWPGYMQVLEIGGIFWKLLLG